MRSGGLFALGKAEGRARSYILGAECLKAIYTAFTTGVFLTGFLLYAGMGQVQIGDSGEGKRCWGRPGFCIMDS